MERPNKIELIDLIDVFLTPCLDETAPTRDYDSLIYSLVYQGYDPIYDAITNTISTEGPFSQSKIRKSKIYWDANTGRIAKTEIYRHGELNHSNSYFFDKYGRIVETQSWTKRNGITKTTDTIYIYPSINRCDNYSMIEIHNGKYERFISAEERIQNEKQLMSLAA